MENQKLSHLFKERKGQSAIEYLMTYGWMLLVVAIVGGAIFATVQNQCAKGSSGWAGQAVTVDSFGANDNDLQVVFKNGAGGDVNITQVEVLDSEGNSIETNTTVTPELGVGEDQLYVFNSISSADSCNSFDVEATYDKDELTGQLAQGTLTGQMAQE